MKHRVLEVVWRITLCVLISTTISEWCTIDVNQFVDPPGWIFILSIMTIACWGHKFVNRKSVFTTCLMTGCWASATGLMIFVHLTQHLLGAAIRFKAAVVFTLIVSVIEFLS